MRKLTKGEIDHLWKSLKDAENHVLKSNFDEDYLLEDWLKKRQRVYMNRYRRKAFLKSCYERIA